MRRTFAPSAAKVVCIDLDRTIIPWGPLEAVRAPFAGAAEAITKLKDAGFTVVILTSRASPSWWAAEAEARGVNAKQFGKDQLAMTARILTEGGIPFDRITSEKVPARAYFDDKGIRVAPEDFALRGAITAFLNGAYE